MGRVDRVLVADDQDLVDDLAVQDGRDEPRPDALDPVRARPATAEHRRCRRLDRDHLGLRVDRLDGLPHARDRPAGADARDEDVDAVLHGLQDLRAGPKAVGLGVGGVGELVGQEAVTGGCGPAGGLDGLVHPAERLDDLDTRAVEPQQRLALARHALRQEDR